MTPSHFIVNVTEADFEYEVLSYSQNTPVVVEFWAEWCQPCKLLEPILENLAQTSGGSFRLARVDVDANPNLALRYGVRTLPTVKAIHQAEVVGEFAGMQPEERIRDFIAHLEPPAEDSLAIERAESLLKQQNWLAAEALYRQLEEQDPANPAILLGLVKSLLAQGKGSEALFILNYFPASREYASAELLRPLAETMSKASKNELPDITELDNMFRNSLRLTIKGNHPAALDGLLDVLRQQKRFANDRARQVFVAILELYDPQLDFIKQYRSELASVLF